MNWGAFLGSFHSSQARVASYERTVNCYIENTGQEAPNAHHSRALMPTPGFVVFATPVGSRGRGIFSQNDRTFAVIDDRLVEVHANGTTTERPLTSLPDFGAAPTVTPSTPTAALAQPNPPRVQQGGGVGVTAYGYKIAAKNAVGVSIASLEGLIATGFAALDASNFNHLTWDEVPNATSGYDVYRTTGGTAPPKLIGTVPQSQRFFQDIGQAGLAQSPPAVNTSGGAAGGTAWGYKVAAVIGLGTTAASAEGTTASGYAALDAEHYNEIKGTVVQHAQAYRIWRTSGPGVSTPVLIGEVTDQTGPQWTFRDTGMVGEVSTPPAANSSATQTLVDDGSPVSISSSGDAGQQLFIVSTGKGYCFDLRTNVFAMVVEGATFGGYTDSYFVVLDAAESKLKLSGILNGFFWNDIEYQQRVAGGDKWVAMAIFNQLVWLIGTETSEVWQHTGAPEPAFPFSKVAPAFIQAGTAAAFSVTVVSGWLMWFGQTRGGGGQVLRTRGAFDAEPISSKHMDAEIQKYRVKADAEGWAYQEGGHDFYVLSFPTAGRTWVFDVQTGEWHERGHRAAGVSDFSVYRPRAVAWAFSGTTEGMHLVVDRASGTIYRMGTEFGLDIAGRPIVRLRRAPHVSNVDREIVHHELELAVDTIGPRSVSDTDATWMLRWSDNGGSTWSNEHWVPVLAHGEPFQRVRWHRLGSSARRVYEVIVADPRPRAIVGARLELTSARH
jgi:hypothetical protein